MKLKKITVTIGAVALAATLFTANVSAQDSQESTKIVAFGDSNTAGSNWLDSWDSADKWVNRLEADGYNIVNAGIGGNTTEDAKKRFYEDVLAHNPTDVTINFGGNDAAMTGPLNPKVDKQQFEENIRYFVSELKENGTDVTLFTSIPTVKGVYYERHPQEWYAPVGGVQAWIEGYNDIIREIAADTGVTLVDMHNRVIEEAGGNSDTALINSGLIDETGNHYSPEGAEFFYENMKPFVDIGHRQSVGNGGVYEQYNNAHVYTIAGNRSQGSVDSNPYNGADVKLEFERNNSGEWTRYKTLEGETQSNGYYRPYLYLSGAYPAGDWRVKTTVEAPTGAEKQFTTPFTIK